ncbi:MAG: hypothetical protein JEY96_17975 [Bacteroidales bacterium]|nr:hypothetical protein [Bacteroidales bacterium]
MEEKKREIGENIDGYSRVRERAAMLAGYINEIKERGISVNAHEPIEGKMSWTEN